MLLHTTSETIATITVHNSINAIGSIFISRRTGVLNFPNIYPNANPTEFNFQAIKIKNKSPMVRTLLGIVVLYPYYGFIHQSLNLIW